MPRLQAIYEKAKNYLLSGHIRQFRALDVFDDQGNLIVFNIDNHQ